MVAAAAMPDWLAGQRPVGDEGGSEGDISGHAGHPHLLAGYSIGTAGETRELRTFLYANLYFHPEVNGANQRACDMMASVFEAYIRDPGQIGREATRRVPNCGLYRAAGDYIAGMTDRYLLGEHARLYNQQT